MFIMPINSTGMAAIRSAEEFRSPVQFISGFPVTVLGPDWFNYFALQASAVRPPNTADAIIDAVGVLENGWDGYDGSAISRAVCANAKRFLLSSPRELSSPEITPTSNGTINFEWSTNGADAYLDIGKTRYTGHIETKGGETFYLDGSLMEQENPDSGGIEQALALISGLLHATATVPSIAQSI
jgi:hypothetical protein